MKKLILLCLSLYMTGLGAQNSLLDSMMLYMPFAGNTNDLGPNNIQAVNASVTLSTDNRSHQGHAYQFNGVSSKISWNSNSALNMQFPITVAAWVYLEDSSLNSPIFTSDAFATAYAGYFMSVSAGKLSFGYGNGIAAGTQYRRSAETVNLMPSKKWFHVVGILDAKNSIRLFVDNQQQSIVYTGTATVNMIFKGGNGAIGYAKNYFGTPDLYMNGKIADVGVWHRALNDLERRQLASLVLWYEFENDLNDKSSYLNKGAQSTNVTFGKDRFGMANSCLRLSGGGSFLQLPSDSTYRSDLPITLSFWVRPDTLVEFQSIINTSDNTNTVYSGVSVDLNYNVLNASINNGLATGPNHRRSFSLSDTLKIGQWHHVVVEFNNRTPLDSITIYLNGQKQSNGVYSGTGQKLGYTTSPGYIGRQTNPFGVDKSFKGSVDQVQIYNASMGAMIAADQFSPSLYLEKGIRDTNILKGEAFTFRCEFVGVGNPTYRWQKHINGTWTDVSGALQDHLNFASVSAQDTGLYRCVATCYNLTLISPAARLGTFENTGIQIFNSENVSVYPNPGTGNFRVEGLDQIQEIYMTDCSGRLIDLNSLNNSAYSMPEHLTQGVYFIRIMSADRSYFLKYVKKD